MRSTRSASRLVMIALFVAVMLLFTGCQSLSEKPQELPPTPREQQAMTPEENVVAIRKLEKQLEEEEGERVTGQLMNLVLLFYCFQ